MVNLYRRLSNRLNRRGQTWFKSDFTADLLAVRNRNLDFMDDARFQRAWDKAKAAGDSGWGEQTPDIRWRCHVAAWAGDHGLTLEGDFVECGVFTGILSVFMCDLLDFGAQKDRTFYLFDTYEGIPIDTVDASEKQDAESYNNLYFDCFEVAEKNFAPWPNAKLVKGFIPESLTTVDIDKVAYLSIDMNNAAPEIAALEYFWERLSPGALVVLDDFGWEAHRLQNDGITDFCKKVGVMPLTIPTGQGLIIKPGA